MNKLVAIFSVEGIESNSEVNFFWNLNHHIGTNKFNIKCKAIGKLGHKVTETHKAIESKIEALTNRIGDALNEISPENYDYVRFYFIGDLDKESEIESMKNAIDIAIPVVEEYMNIANTKWDIHKEIIGDPGCNLEDILYPESRPEFILLEKHKKGSVKRFFDIWAEHHNISTTSRETLIDSLKSFFRQSNIKLIISSIE